MAICRRTGGDCLNLDLASACLAWSKCLAKPRTDRACNVIQGFSNTAHDCLPSVICGQQAESVPKLVTSRELCAIAASNALYPTIARNRRLDSCRITSLRSLRGFETAVCGMGERDLSVGFSYSARDESSSSICHLRAI